MFFLEYIPLFHSFYYNIKDQIGMMKFGMAPTEQLHKGSPRSEFALVLVLRDY